jgi:hypothetical protein
MLPQFLPLLLLPLPLPSLPSHLLLFFYCSTSEAVCYYRENEYKLLKEESNASSKKQMTKKKTSNVIKNMHQEAFNSTSLDVSLQVMELSMPAETSISIVNGSLAHAVKFTLFPDYLDIGPTVGFSPALCTFDKPATLRLPHSSANPTAVRVVSFTSVLDRFGNQVGEWIEHPVVRPTKSYVEVELEALIGVVRVIQPPTVPELVNCAFYTSSLGGPDAPVAGGTGSARGTLWVYGPRVDQRRDLQDALQRTQNQRYWVGNVLLAEVESMAIKRGEELMIGPSSALTKRRMEEIRDEKAAQIAAADQSHLLQGEFETKREWQHRLENLKTLKAAAGGGGTATGGESVASKQMELLVWEGKPTSRDFAFDPLFTHEQPTFSKTLWLGASSGCVLEKTVGSAGGGAGGGMVSKAGKGRRRNKAGAKEGTSGVLAAMMGSSSTSAAVVTTDADSGEGTAAADEEADTSGPLRNRVEPQPLFFEIAMREQFLEPQEKRAYREKFVDRTDKAAAQMKRLKQQRKERKKKLVPLLNLYKGGHEVIVVMVMVTVVMAHDTRRHIAQLALKKSHFAPPCSHMSCPLASSISAGAPRGVLPHDRRPHSRQRQCR